MRTRPKPPKLNALEKKEHRKQRESTMRWLLARKFLLTEEISTLESRLAVLKKSLHTIDRYIARVPWIYNVRMRKP